MECDEGIVTLGILMLGLMILEVCGSASHFGLRQNVQQAIWLVSNAGPNILPCVALVAGLGTMQYRGEEMTFIEVLR